MCYDFMIGTELWKNPNQGTVSILGVDAAGKYQILRHGRDTFRTFFYSEKIHIAFHKGASWTKILLPLLPFQTTNGPFQIFHVF